MQNEGYQIPAKQVVTELIIKKSRFIAHLKPVASEEEAKDFIEEIRTKHRGANHNVPTYIIREPGKCLLERCSDDGEPVGTAGKPVLDVLKRTGLTNVAIVVTRYFGGILLGTGGLIRAYTDAAKKAIDEAGYIHMKPFRKITLKINYSLFNQVRRYITDNGGRLGNVKYGSNIVITAYIAPDREKFIEIGIQELTNAAAIIDFDKIEFLP